MTYIEGYKGHMSGPNGRITRVVMHSTVSPTVPGGARNVAAYFQRPDSGGLAHYVVDPHEVIQCAPEDVQVWHAPPNAGSLGIELCDPSAGSPDRWRDPVHQQMLTLAASKVAAMCDVYDLPAVWLTPEDLVNGHRGITSHLNVSKAFGQSDHTDPGDFPWHWWVYDRPNSVKAYLAQRKRNVA